MCAHARLRQPLRQSEGAFLLCGFALALVEAQLRNRVSDHVPPSAGSDHQQSGTGAHSRGSLAGGDEDRVPYRGKRWGVGEVQSRHLLNGHVVPERGRGGVDPLGRALATDDLGPQQPSGVAFRGHLDRQVLCSREVGRPSAGLHAHRHIAEPGLRWPRVR